jgi:UDP-N-acetylmuramoyl-tripeptide--D-alanyl-D-alanine ligase
MVLSITSLLDRMHIKKLGKQLLASLLERQVRAVRRRNSCAVIAVAGSVGKTTTKLATAELLRSTYRVQYQAGNYNDRLTVPLVFFGYTQPSIWNVFAWARVVVRCSIAARRPYPYDVVVVELGTDGPGQLQKFAYLRPDITILTAITPEHMEYFKTLDAVAVEELTVFNFSKQVLVNTQTVPAPYLQGKRFVSYGTESQSGATYCVSTERFYLGGQDLQIHTPSGMISETVQYMGVQGALCTVAAVAAADLLGMPHHDIADALRSLRPFAGRMQVLAGIQGSTIIDDTYNATPIATKAALDVLYAAPASQRIAVLGSMNELGEYTQEAHETVGAYCEAKKLAFVVTLGADAQKWLAPAAQKNGCTVVSFRRRRECAHYILQHIQTGAVILAKGSQNGVFAEEVVKYLLADPADASRLVRQSTWWLAHKEKDDIAATL